MTPYEITAFSVLGLGILLSWLSFRYQLGLLCECIEGLATEHEEQHETLRIGLFNVDSFARGESNRALARSVSHENSLANLAANLQRAVNTFDASSESLEAHSLSLRTQAQAHADRTEAHAFSRFTREVPKR